MGGGGGGVLLKKFFPPFGPQFGLKIREVAGGPPEPLAFRLWGRRGEM